MGATGDLRSGTEGGIQVAALNWWTPTDFLQGVHFLATRTAKRWRQVFHRCDHVRVIFPDTFRPEMMHAARELNGPANTHNRIARRAATSQVKGATLQRGCIAHNRLLGDRWNSSAKNKPVAGHDCRQLLAIWRPACIHHFLYIEKVLRTQVRRQYDKCFGGGLVRVAECMD